MLLKRGVATPSTPPLDPPLTVIINLEILTYWSALRKVFQDKTEKCLDNAAVYVDLTEEEILWIGTQHNNNCLLYTSPSPRDLSTSRMPSSA